MWYKSHNFESKMPYLEARMRILKGMRAHFDAQGFWEVETPILQVMPGADVHIHAFEVENGQYLQNSPEFAMKKLLVAGCPRIYQICKAFRRENCTKLHNPEFTIAEWYRTAVDYTAIMADCETLLKACAAQYRFNDKICDPHKTWQKITVCDAFHEYAGIDLSQFLGDSLDIEGFRAAADLKNIRTLRTDSWDDIFHAVMGVKIEPYLGLDAPTILYEYPAHMAALSRKKPNDQRFAERFELYVCGVELANAFTELTDAVEQRVRFQTDMEEKQAIYGESYPIDEEFLEALEHGLPPCAGIALGVDRLVMLATNARDIQQVLWTG